MKIKDYKPEELEAMSYDELAAMILQEYGKKMKIQDLFKKVCKLLNISEEKFADKITDFFELLSTNKKFIMLNNGYWDLKTNHKTKIVIDDEDDDDIIVDSPIDDEDEEDKDDNPFYEIDETDDNAEDDLKELVIIDEDEEESNGVL